MTKHVQKYIKLIIFSIMAAAIFLFGNTLVLNISAEGSGYNPHELKDGMGNATCTDCHRQKPEQIPERATRVVLPDMNDFLANPVAMCTSCHEGDEGSHPIGVKPKYPVPADLPLDKKGGVSCCTCHYTHGSLESDHPCCSVSFMDRMLNSDRMKKSFLLRRENTKGELCKACHEKYT